MVPTCGVQVWLGSVTASRIFPTLNVTAHLKTPFYIYIARNILEISVPFFKVGAWGGGGGAYGQRRGFLRAKKYMETARTAWLYSSETTEPSLSLPFKPLS